MKKEETTETLLQTKPLTETQQLVFNFLSEERNANSNAELIESCLPSLNKLTILKTLKGLTEKGFIIKSNETPSTYTIATVVEEDEKITNENSMKKEKKKKESDEVVLQTSGRNTNKFIFNKMTLSKSRLVLEVLKQFITDHEDYTLEQVQETWNSEELQKRYGTIVKTTDAQKFCEGGRERHFMKDVLTVGKKKVVVCNQWSEELLQPFLKTASNLKYKITRE
jgi:Fe2+ or Zn2+ uptake regulation protein